MCVCIYSVDLSHAYFHKSSYHNIAGADDGIEEIEGGGVILKCLQTRTGIKFVLT